MILIVKELEILGLRSELAITPKPLGSKESSVIGIIKALHHTITPGFSYRDEDHLHPQQQTKSQNDAKGTRVTIASPEAEFVVDLEKVWNTHTLPTTKQAQSHGLVVFPSLRMEKDSVAQAVLDIERIETCIVLDVSGSHEIRLMDMVDSQRSCEIGVLDPFGDIRSFF
jgi:hypothetical protein